MLKLSQTYESRTKRYYSARNIPKSNTVQNNPSNNNPLKSEISLSSDIISNSLFNIKEIQNNNSSNIIRIHSNNPSSSQKNKYITINDIIGPKRDINLDILRYYFSSYEDSKTSKKKMGYIKSYAVNTYQGLVRSYNEDRVSIIVNMSKPRGYYKKIWPRVSFFGIYDGHGGELCSEYLRDNLHKLICQNNEFFPENIPEAIKLGFSKAEKNFLEKYALDKNKEFKDKSGSCAVILLLVENIIYIANLGDSRCVMSIGKGKKYIQVTKDHKPNINEETTRIKNNGGNIYQTDTIIRKTKNPKLIGKILVGPYRVTPGGLSVSRTIGDIEAKNPKYGGNPNVVISEPDIFVYDLNKDDIDFFVLGCDGIFDQVSSDEVINCAWMIYQNIGKDAQINKCKDLHDISGIIVDYIMKSALARKSFDNVTCLFIAFKDLVNFDNNNNKEIEDKNIITNNERNNIRRSFTSRTNIDINSRERKEYIISNNYNINNNKADININNSNNKDSKIKYTRWIINSNNNSNINNQNQNQNNINTNINTNNINKRENNEFRRSYNYNIQNKTNNNQNKMNNYIINKDKYKIPNNEEHKVNNNININEKNKVHAIYSINHRNVLDKDYTKTINDNNNKNEKISIRKTYLNMNKNNLNEKNVIDSANHSNNYINSQYKYEIKTDYRINSNKNQYYINNNIIINKNNISGTTSNYRRRSNYNINSQ